MTPPDIHLPQRPVTYLLLPPGERHPEIAHLAPFQAVVIVDAEVDSAWQFSKHCAIHPTVDLKNTLLLHIAVESQETKLLKIYGKA